MRPGYDTRGAERRENLQTLKLCKSIFERLQMQLKEVQHDVDEPNKTWDILALKLKELEKIRTYEAELKPHPGNTCQHEVHNLASFQGLPPSSFRYAKM